MLDRNRSITNTSYRAQWPWHQAFAASKPKEGQKENIERFGAIHKSISACSSFIRTSLKDFLCKAWYENHEHGYIRLTFNIGDFSETEDLPGSIRASRTNRPSHACLMKRKDFNIICAHCWRCEEEWKMYRIDWRNLIIRASAEAPCSRHYELMFSSSASWPPFVSRLYLCWHTHNFFPRAHAHPFFRDKSIVLVVSTNLLWRQNF